MKRMLLLVALIVMAISCSSRKQMEKALNSGNYDHAISTALKKLATNKDKKSKEDFIVMLQAAYKKATNRDLNRINQLKQDGNPEFYKSIFEIYADLNARQEAIKPLLPLYVNGRMVKFEFNDYTSQIVQAKNEASNYLYNKGLELLNSNSKFDSREAYNTFNYIQRINPNYKDVKQLMQEAHFLGTNFVIVSVSNQTQQVIPKRLEQDLLNMNTYNLNDFWTAYHAQPSSDVDYDYSMELQLKNINISPEQIRERSYNREKEVVDGWEYLLDRNGNVVKDSLGNDIKIDKIVRVQCNIIEVSQFKSSQVKGRVIYQDLKSRQPLDNFPLASEFIFENIYASYQGDSRALTDEDRRLINGRPVPFPSNEQMVYDTGENLKLRLKQIIKSFSPQI
ncbi:hypothetical protein [Mangrovimonas aestuarii]|uniref:hypothetical protein n=1 Tax=Mangrovimonas aestuarii TaxID=3018443 RepID=UPI002379F74A|nr:hypothetical protein [Mangrovimonas aestuarii]